MKSKVDSVQELVDDCQPNLCLVESHMQEEEEIRIPGYNTIYQNDKASNSGGIINRSQRHSENNHTSKARNRGQTLWILLYNQKKKKKKVGVI